MTEQRSASALSAPQHSALLATATDDNSAPCRGSFFAYDGQGSARGICGNCEQDAAVHEFDIGYVR